MRQERDARFEDERARFGLRFECEDCALFEARDASCAHGFPTEPHRRPAAPARGALLVFCKDFECA